MVVNAKIRLESIVDNDDRWSEAFNLTISNQFMTLVTCFGNGIFKEVRVVGEAKAGILLFMQMVKCGGYKRGSCKGAERSNLFQPGDMCYPEKSPFVFVCPTAENGEQIDLANATEDLETVLKSLEGEGPEVTTEPETLPPETNPHKLRLPETHLPKAHPAKLHLPEAQLSKPYPLPRSKRWWQFWRRK